MTILHRNVLLAVDKSADSRHALEYVLQDVCTPKDKLFILHVREPVLVTRPGQSAGDFVMPTDIMNELQRQAEAEGEEFIKEYTAMAEKAQIPCEGYYVEGDAQAHVITEVKKNRVDLVVLGSHGMGAVQRALLGSVSSYCLHHASCPVLIVRRLEAQPWAVKLDGKRTVVIAVDKSRLSKEAFRWAIHNVCRPEKDHLVLLTAEPLPMGACVTECATIGDEDTEERLEKSMERETLKGSRLLLDQLAQEAYEAGLESSQDVVKGDARVAILAAAERHHGDLLVLGSRGLGAFSRMFVGSVSDYCSHNAHCPVLVVRPHEEHKGALFQVSLERR